MRDWQTTVFKIAGSMLRFFEWLNCLDLLTKLMIAGVPIIPRWRGWRFLPMCLAEAKRCDLAVKLASALLHHFFKLKLVPVSVKSPIPIAARKRRLCLKEAVEALQAHGLRPFLAYGTLLGYAREGDLLPHDGDVDIGLFADETSPTIVLKTLKAGGFKPMKTTSASEPDLVKARHRSGANLDVIFFSRNQPEMFITRRNRYGETILRRRTPFDLIDTEFLGFRVAIPNPPEVFLIEQYGDWKTPISGFYHPFLSPQIPTDMNQPVIQFIARYTLLGLLYRGRWQFARECVETLLTKMPQDAFWLNMHEKIKGYP